MKHLSLVMALLLPLPALCAEKEHRQHGAHEHGSGRLGLVLDGTTLEIEISAPAESFVGFEFEPKTEAQKKAAKEAHDILKVDKNVFSLPNEAECGLQKAEFEGAVFNDFNSDKGDSPTGSQAKETGKGHSDAQITYSWQCLRPNLVRKIRVLLFAKFPRLHELNATTVSNGKQGTSVLKKGKEEISGL